MQTSLIKNIILSALLSLFALLPAGNTYGQEHLTDASLIMSRFGDTVEVKGKDISFMQPSGDGFVARYNPFTLTLGGLMFVYQRFMSPQLPSECLYHPSCSSFSKSLISEYGLVAGVAATADRLIRCNRVAVFDIHPMHFDERTGKVKEAPDIYRKKTE